MSGDPNQDGPVPPSDQRIIPLPSKLVGLAQTLQQMIASIEEATPEGRRPIERLATVAREMGGALQKVNTLMDLAESNAREYTTKNQQATERLREANERLAQVARREAGFNQQPGTSRVPDIQLQPSPPIPNASSFSPHRPRPREDFRTAPYRTPNTLTSRIPRASGPSNPIPTQQPQYARSSTGVFGSRTLAPPTTSSYGFGGGLHAHGAQFAPGAINQPLSVPGATTPDSDQPMIGATPLRVHISSGARIVDSALDATSRKLFGDLLLEQRRTYCRQGIKDGRYLCCCLVYYKDKTGKPGAQFNDLYTKCGICDRKKRQCVVIDKDDPNVALIICPTQNEINIQQACDRRYPAV